MEHLIRPAQAEKLLSGPQHSGELTSSKPGLHSVLLLQRHVGNHAINRLMESATRNRRLANPGMSGVGAEFEGAIQEKRGGGERLNNNLRTEMEAAFGYDFTDVRVHRDGEAGRLNQAIHARAFTTGKDIFFARGAYNPDSAAGLELVAHELTHVVQQRGNKVQAKLVLGSPGGPYEQEADSVARQIVTAPPDTLRRQCACGEGSAGVCRCREKQRIATPVSLEEMPAISPLRRSPLVNTPPLPSAVILRQSVHPEEQHCEEVSQEPDPGCAAIIECIEELIEQLAQRFSDIDNLGGDKGHITRIAIVQGILATLMTMAAIACKNGEYDSELEEEARKWRDKPAQKQAPDPQPDPEPSFREKIAEALKKAGIPAWAVAGLIVLIIAALADPEPFSKVVLLIGAAAAVILFIAIGRGSDVPPSA